MKISEFFETEKAKHMAGQEALLEEQSGLSAVSDTVAETEIEEGAGTINKNFDEGATELI